MKQNLFVILGTRPEVIKLAPVIRELKRLDCDLPVLVCSTGQHKTMLSTALQDFGIAPDYELHVMRDRQSLGGLTARLIDGLEELFSVNPPGGIIVQGDTTTAFAASLSGFYRQVPIFHVEAGLRTGDFSSPFPEEFNRAIIAKLATLHFSPTEKAADCLLSEGVASDRILTTGNTVVDAIRIMCEKGLAPEELNLPTHIQAACMESKIVLITAHRRESHDGGIHAICEAIKILAHDFPDYQFIFPVHLNPIVREAVFSVLPHVSPNITLMEPLGFRSLLFIQSVSALIITDSGGIQEEAPYFGVPVLVTRERTERAEGVSAGFSTLVGTNTDLIISNAHRILKSNLRSELKKTNNPYGDGYAAIRIVRSIERYFRSDDSR